ncbi:MAG: UDP-N-acetylglucosamine 2-epimerase (non-hydrolyzing), partial [Anaerolineae bacterium]|nr:UDP-N-acetylglucosamine 2-epimerase (non-hydrolyzing) [Anaerolineae bacterium]
MMKVLSIFGTRPEAVKMAPIVQALQGHSDQIESIVCVTAQHRQMLDQVLQLFKIQPHYDLNVMRPDQSLSQVTASVLTGLDPILKDVKPDWVLVQGDTTTVMAAALAAFYHRIRVGHVEAGLRTWNKHHPFPEEVNRKIATSICDLHFCPTEVSRQNLLREGVPDETIRVTGNTVIDALNLAVQMPYDASTGPLKDVPWDKRLILVTAHRRENFGAPLEQICAALREIAETYRDTTHLVYPVHLNPNVQGVAKRLLADVPNVTLTEPLDYLPLVYLMKRATLVITDSGGIQEEAPGLGKPVLVLRETTERLDLALEAGRMGAFEWGPGLAAAQLDPPGGDHLRLCGGGLQGERGPAAGAPAPGG